MRLQNFKAIRDSKTIPLTPLTALIGYNGSGKSSVVEGLETLQHIVRYGLDAAMQDWRGFEHIWNRHTSQSAPSEPDRTPAASHKPDAFQYTRKDKARGFCVQDGHQYGTFGGSHFHPGRTRDGRRQGDIEGGG